MPVVEHFATFSDHLKSPEAKMILRMKDVCSELGVSRASIYRLLESGSFPKPLKLGKRDTVPGSRPVLLLSRQAIWPFGSPAM